MSQPERLLENSLSVASSRLMSAPGSCKADGQYASSAQTQHLSRGKRKRADGYSEVDNKFIIQSVQSADEEGKPIPWDWIGSNLQRTTGAVKKQYQRIKPSLDKIVKGAERSTTADETKRTDRSDRAKDRGGKRLIIKTQRAMPDADETSAEEPHSDPQQPHGTGVNEDVAATASAPELHRPFGMPGSLKNNDANTDNINGNRFKKEGVKPNGLRICMKEAWATIVDSDVSIEVAANGLLALKSSSPTSPDGDFL